MSIVKNPIGKTMQIYLRSTVKYLVIIFFIRAKKITLQVLLHEIRTCIISKTLMLCAIFTTLLLKIS